VRRIYERSGGMILSDGEIIQRVNAGDTREFAVLLERYQNKAYTLAIRLLKNREDAEEATQDAFIRAFRALKKFQGSSSFGTWLYRIVYNVSLSKLSSRKDIFQPLETENEDDEPQRELAIEPSAVDTTYEKEETKNLVRKAIEKLPQHYQVILTLFYLEELRYDEICEVTGLPVGTVKTHLFRARTALQKIISHEFSREEISL